MHLYVAWIKEWAVLCDGVSLIKLIYSLMKAFRKVIQRTAQEMGVFSGFLLVKEWVHLVFFCWVRNVCI